MTALRTNFNAGDNFTHDDANQAGINVNGATLTGTFSAMPTAGQPSRLPPTSGWSTNTMGTSTVTADKDGFQMVAVGSGTSADALRFHYRTYPATPFTATFYFDWNIRLHDSSSAGGIFISNGTKFLAFQAAVGNIYVSEYWNSTDFNAHEFSNSNLLAAYELPHWMRFTDDGTNRNFLLSANGVDWVSVYSTSRTTWLTPTQIGWGMNTKASSGSKSYGRLRSLTGI